MTLDHGNGRRDSFRYPRVGYSDASELRRAEGPSALVAGLVGRFMYTGPAFALFLPTYDLLKDSLIKITLSKHISNCLLELPVPVFLQLINNVTARASIWRHT